MLCDFCVQMPEIMAFYHMVGNFNVLLCFAVPDVKTLDALVSRVRTFGDSRTSIELQTVFEKVDPTNRTVSSDELSPPSGLASFLPQAKSDTTIVRARINAKAFLKFLFISVLLCLKKLNPQHFSM